MERSEINILEILANESEVSQRDIAKKANISLGMVNSLIKKCVKKGFVKIENLNARSVRYILTPKGIEEKAKKTLEYISKSYRAIQYIDVYIRKVTLKAEKRNMKIVVLGLNDEMKEIVKKTLKDMGIQFEVFNSVDKIEYDSKKLVYIWESVYEKELSQKSFEYINLMSI